MTPPITLPVTLAPGDLDLIADRVAAILAARAPVQPASAYIVVGEAARILGISPKTIQNYLSAGRLTRHGGPRRPLVARAEVEALAAGSEAVHRRNAPFRSRRPGVSPPAYSVRVRHEIRSGVNPMESDFANGEGGAFR